MSRKSAASLAILPAGPVTFQPRPPSDPPQPPAHLGKPERAIWANVFSDFSVSTDTATAVLVSALESHQRARLAREQVDAD